MSIYFNQRTDATDSLLKKTTSQKEGDWYFTFTKRNLEFPTLQILLLYETVTKTQSIKKEKNVWTIRLDFEKNPWNEIFERSTKHPLVFECMLNTSPPKFYPLFISPVFFSEIQNYSIGTKYASQEVKKYFDAIQIKVVKKDFGTRLLIRMREI